MMMLAPLVLSMALLAASPGSPGGGVGIAQAPPLMTVANILGAATACHGIAPDQVSAAAHKVGALAKARAKGAGDAAVIDRLLIRSAAAGRQAVVGGKLDCRTVETAFSNLEQVILQTEVAQRTRG